MYIYMCYLVRFVCSFNTFCKIGRSVFLFWTEVNILKREETRPLHFVSYHNNFVLYTYITHWKQMISIFSFSRRNQQKLAHHSSFACKIHTKRQLFVPYTPFLIFFLLFYLRICSFFIYLNETNETSMCIRLLLECYEIVDFRNQWTKFDYVESFRL